MAQHTEQGRPRPGNAESLLPFSLQEADEQTLLIEKSHRRSLGYGLNGTSRPDYTPVGKAELSTLLEANKTLHAYALPVMETLYAQIRNTHSMVLLTDARGCILQTMGDEDFLEKANQVALNCGIEWSEQSKGTNAIGTAIAEQTPVLVHAHEHYLHANHILTCSAAPIIDHASNVVGVLDVTGDHRSYHKHTMALVRMSAQMIENQLFSANFQDAITLHFNARPEFIGTLMEGIASFSPGGRFLAANRVGLFQLGLPMGALQTHTFSSLFGMPLSSLFDHYRTAAPELLNLCLHTGVRVYARAELRLKHHVIYAATDAGALDGRNSALTANSLQRHQPNRHAVTADKRLSSLRYLNTGDPRLAEVIHKIQKVMGRDIPILITGETGTGKELLAQAIHNDSPRHDSPFVAVNCASIPETLIESELFGYEEGAFTGARKKGNKGKIQQANGGTLFLDEIGDMPYSLQARLLRVLQERVVTPLGSTQPIPVNIDLICATHRNLRELIAAGRFREDLYYRLNGLVVKLPPLRERTDIETLIAKIISSESTGIVYQVSPDIITLFKQHKWPGNFRQMANLLRTAMVMAEDCGEIRLEHLPEDFFEDVETRQLGIAPALAATTHASLETLALDVIKEKLDACGGNIAATARALGVSRNTIYRKLYEKKY